MSAWRVFVCDLRDGSPLGEIDADGSVSTRLNEGSRGSLTTSFESIPILADRPLARVVVSVEVDGKILSAGPIQHLSFDLANETVSIDVASIDSRLQYRILDGDFSRSGLPLNTIVADLLAAAQKPDTLGAPSPPADLRVDSTDLAAATGWPTATLESPWWEYRTVSSQIADLMTQTDGFDLDLRPEWSARKIRWKAVGTYPGTGRSTDWILDEFTSHITKVDYDVSNLANRVVATGKGSYSDTAVVANLNSWSIDKHGLFERTDRISDAADTGPLWQRIAWWLRRGADMIVLPTVQVPTSIIADEFFVGDIVRVDYPRLGLTGAWRVVEISPQIGAEYHSITLASSEAF